MQFDQYNPTHRAGVALVVAVLIAFALWGSWMLIGFLLWAIGWLASRFGDGLLTASSTMGKVHFTVAWVGLGCGAIVGAIIGFNLRVDRLWDRLAKSKQPVEDSPVG